MNATRHALETTNPTQEQLDALRAAHARLLEATGAAFAAQRLPQLLGSNRQLFLDEVAKHAPIHDAFCDLVGEVSREMVKRAGYKRSTRDGRYLETEFIKRIHAAVGAEERTFVRWH